jgi:hypothetical protein
MTAPNADPMDRRPTYTRLLTEGKTVRAVALELGIAYTSAHAYAKLHFPELIEISRRNARKAASKRMLSVHRSRTPMVHGSA